MLIWLLVFRCLAVTAGALLLYAGLFLRESEERNVENVLDTWWIRIDDLRRSAIDGHIAITNAAAGLVSHALDRLLGERIWSLRAAATAACLSFVSLHFSTMFLHERGMQFIHTVDAETLRPEDALATLLGIIFWGAASIFTSLAIPSEPLIITIPGLVTLLCIIAGAASRRFANAAVVGLVFAWSFLGTLWFAGVTGLAPDMSAGVFIDISALGMALDIGAIALIRTMIRRQTSSRSFLTLLLLAIAELALAGALLVGPIVVGLFLLLVYALPSLSLLIAIWAWEIALSSFTNLLAAAIAGSLFVALSLLLAHHLLWPFIERPLYRIARFGVFRHPLGRPMLISVGAATLTVAITGSDALIAFVLRFLGST